MSAPSEAFDLLVKEMATASSAIARAERAVEAGKQARYEVENCKINIDTGYGRTATDLQKATQQQLVAYRLGLATTALETTRKQALIEAVTILEAARRRIPHLVAAAMVDLGGRAGAMRALARDKDLT